MAVNAIDKLQFLSFIPYMVQQIQQFKLLSSLFKVNMQLHIKYSRIMNPIFYQQLKCISDEYQVPIVHSVFK